MANHKSAIKRDRQSKIRRANNRSNSSRLNSQLRLMKQALSSKSIDEVKKLLPDTLSLIDKSIHKGVLHKNAASRKKSRLMLKVNALLSTSATA